jgi:hypothetical protein
MSLRTESVATGEGQATVGVDIELEGPLVARAGARRGRVLVPQGSTVVDAVTAWAEKSGSHLRYALLCDDRLRTQVDAVRITDGRNERLVASQPVRDGDTIRFEFHD